MWKEEEGVQGWWYCADLENELFSAQDLKLEKLHTTSIELFF